MPTHLLLTHDVGVAPDQALERDARGRGAAGGGAATDRRIGGETGVGESGGGAALGARLARRQVP